LLFIILVGETCITDQSLNLTVFVMINLILFFVSYLSDNQLTLYKIVFKFVKQFFNEQI